MLKFKSFAVEDLRKWFSKTDPEGGWKRINSKGEAIGPCAREPGEPKPKCMSNEKRAKLSKKERASAVRAKRKHDPNPERKGEPINVSNFGKGKISESMEQIDEKNVPTSPEKWARAKAQAKAKFDVYPSAYANGWASKKYKEMGGKWKSVSEKKELLSFKSFINERCWPGYKEVPGKKAYEKGSCKKEEVEQIEEMDKSQPSSSRGAEGVPTGKKAKPSKTDKVKTDALKVLQKQYKKVKEEVELDEVAAWQRKEGKSESGGLNRKGIESYRRENPGSKLSMAVTTKPSKLKKGSKSAKRRLSFCRRMTGMKRKLTSAKTARDPDSRINKALRKWNC
jgi:hypothetical protein